MNTQEYIASGILEAYVLGDLSEKERADVERLVAENPELLAERERIETVQEKLLMRTSIQPRAQVKNQLFDKIKSESKESETTNIIPITSLRKQVSTWRWAAAASISALLVTTYLAVSYHTKWKSTESNLTELVAKNQQVAQDYNVVNQRLDEIQSELTLVNNPLVKRVIMKGTETAPQALASIYWNETTSEVYLRVHNLQQIASDKQFQLWAIVEGKPVDAGVFDSGAEGLLKMKTISNASAFAVTIEPRGGSASPALETMQVIGNT